jgi:hypothetical protein
MKNVKNWITENLFAVKHLISPNIHHTHFNKLTIDNSHFLRLLSGRNEDKNMTLDPLLGIRTLIQRKIMQIYIYNKNLRMVPRCLFR